MGIEDKDMAPTLTVKEASILLKVSTKTVLRWISQGRLPARKAGRAWRLPPSALDEWLTDSKAETKQD